MTKTKKKSSRSTNPDQGALALFDIISVDATRKETRLCKEADFKTAMAEDVKHAIDEHGKPITRWEVVDRLSRLLGEKITWHTLNNWTAPSHESHMPSVQQLVAFVMATGGQRRAVTAAFRPAGIFPLPGPVALQAEEQRLTEDIQHLRNQKKECRLLRLNIERKAA